MVDVTRTFTVSKPLEQVVEYLKDFGNAEAWDPGTQSCTRTDAGPVAVGSTWHNVSKILGKETGLTYALQLSEPNRLTFVGENKSATSTDDLTFQTVGEGTVVTYHAHVVFHGIAKLAGPLMQVYFNRLGVQTEKQLTETLNAL